MIQVNPDRLYPVYERLPIALQHLANSATGLGFRRLRYGGTFAEHLARLRESALWPYARLKAYQDERLRQVIRAAYRNVPFYRTRFDRAGIEPDRVRCVADLAALPILTKEEVREHFEQLIDPTVPARELIPDHTSGSTGKSLRLVYTREAVQEQNAVWARHRAQFGDLDGRPYATFQGRAIVPISQARAPFWRVNWAARQTLFSIYHLSDVNLPAYLDHLCSGKFDYVTGYPSALVVVADAMLRAGRTMPRALACVLTSSETLNDSQRTLLHRAFACPVSDHYGLAEMAASASRCEHGAYHEDMEFCVHEYLPAEGAAGFNWLVGTSLANPAMPLIRYGTGDLAAPSDEACACGRASRVITSLDGRIDSLVVLPNGAKVGRLDHIFKDCLAIRDAQIVQTRAAGLTVRVVRRPGFGPSDERFLLSQVRMRLGNEIRVDVDYVDELPRGPGGKLRAVMSTILP